jgi:hypothetical protein
LLSTAVFSFHEEDVRGDTAFNYGKTMSSDVAHALLRAATTLLSSRRVKPGLKGVHLV